LVAARQRRHAYRGRPDYTVEKLGKGLIAVSSHFGKAERSPQQYLSAGGVTQIFRHGVRRGQGSIREIELSELSRLEIGKSYRSILCEFQPEPTESGAYLPVGADLGLKHTLFR
jgi:hypothetical protein